jgi:hypothetical protein
MKITNKLIALAIVCAGIPATVLAKSQDTLAGIYLVSISVDGLRQQISALADCKESGALVEYDFVPPGKLEVGEGHWSRTAQGFTINYTTPLENGEKRMVTGFVTRSAPANHLTGSGKVQVIKQDGTVVETRNVTVTAVESQSRFAAKR